MVSTTTITEADILEKVVSPRDADLNREAARSFLGFKFDSGTTRHIRQLLRKNNRGSISAEERIVLEKYLRVGQLIDLLHAKARLSLRENGASHHLPKHLRRLRPVQRSEGL
jgi:hypothetical protein